MKRLGVNIDHVATVRNARGSSHPDPFTIAKHVMECGAHSITIHLRKIIFQKNLETHLLQSQEVDL